jgi:sugar phosphate permease
MGERRVFVLLLLGYASFYLCRANLDAAGPMLQQLGYSKAELGRVASLAIASYAVGKVVLGALGDRIGGKRVMLLALFGSVVANVCIGASSGLFMLGVFAVINRFFQSGGWGGLVHVVSRWFPPGKHGAIMGALSTSYELGNVATLLFCGLLAHVGFGWRALFLFNPAFLAIMGVALLLLLRGEPPKRDATPGDGHVRPPPSTWRFREAFPWLAKKPAFWIAVLLSMLLTFVRTGFLTWTPIYLAEVARAAGSETAVSGAMMKSAIFPATGVVAALVTGLASDRLGPGRRAPAIVVSLTVHVVAVLALAHLSIRDSIVATAAIGACGLFLLGPYSLMAGAITLDIAGTRAAATAAGFIDGAGYAGASLVGVVIGGVAERWGWSAAFDVVAAAGAAATLLAAGWWMSLKPPAKEPNADPRTATP